jgi:WD40 repeat protein
VNSAVFSPDGKTVLTTSDDKTARLWEAASGKEIAVLRVHEGDVNSAVFSPDGKTVLTTSSNTTGLWEAASGKEIAVLRVHEGDVNSAVFSPDGKTVLTASHDQTARLWRVFPKTQDLVDASKQLAPRCLSPSLREQFFLRPEPPLWCIETEKWPYHTQDWKDWLKFSRANLSPPLPDTPEWQPYVATRQTGSAASSDLK